MKVLARPCFYEDVAEEVFWLLQNAGPDVARQWHEDLWSTVNLLKKSPHIGRKRADLQQPGIRSWRVENFNRWLVFYGVREDAIVLYRVRSGTMDLSALWFAQ